MADQFVTITFPDLLPAEASQLTTEFEQEMLRAGTFHVFGAIAHFERRLIGKRTRDGLAAAKPKG